MEPFEILAEHFRPMVLAYLKSLVRDEHLAEDLTQETFLAAQAGLEGFIKGASFGAWVRGIARNKVLESRRAAARHPMVADSRIIEGMEEVYSVLDSPGVDRESWSDRVRLLRDCTSKLSGPLREAVSEVYQQGRSLQEAARVLEVSFSSVAQRLHRARELLFECISMRLKA